MRLTEVTKDDLNCLVGLLPVGSVEQHGPHLPMGTDSLIAEEVARRVEGELRDEVTLFPTIYYTCSLEHEGFPYVGVSYTTFLNYLTEVLESGLRLCKAIVLVLGHGGVTSVVDLARRQLNFRSGDRKVYAFFVMASHPKGGSEDLHAGSLESSAIKAIRPELVKEERLENVDFDFREGVFEVYTVKESNPYGIVNRGEVRVDVRLGEEFLTRATRGLKELVMRIIEGLK